MKLVDWRGRLYDFDVAYVSFLCGYVVWIDGEPYNEGEPFTSKWDAVKHLSNEGLKVYPQ